MDITNWTSKEFVKHLIAHKGGSQSGLGLKVFEQTGQNYQANTFTNKVFRDDLKLKEVQAACKILGYKLVLEEIEK